MSVRSHVETLLQGSAPVVAASDYVRAVPAQIAPYIDGRLTILGTDGFGRSASRPALRSFFEVNRYHVVLGALEALVREGTLERSVLSNAISETGVDPSAPAPWQA